jgi:DNA-binding NtrC family response regulator
LNTPPPVTAAPAPSKPEAPPLARILVVEDEKTFRELLERQLARRGYEVIGCGSGEEAVVRAQELECDLALLDLALPGISGIDTFKKLRELRPSIEAIMLTGHGSLEIAIEAMKAGAFHYFSKPVKMAELEVYIGNACEKRRLARENRDLKEELARTGLREGAVIVGEHPVIERVRELISKVAASPSPVLVEGESGTGKDLAARAIHAASTRRDRAYVAINCGALSESLLENELFGHVAGAFTGATKDGRGLFEVADGGTLFIDEVCEMSLEIQKKFLRVLENGEFRRLGEARVRKADVRVIAATNRIMKDEVAAGRFRDDLSYRLNVLAVRMPPLRERLSDVPLLVDHFLKRDAHRYPKGARVTEDALTLFRTYRWPGNVRELQNVLERGVILSPHGVVRPEDCPGLTQDTTAPPPRAVPVSGPVAVAGGGDLPQGASSDVSLSELEKRHILQTLERCQGNKTLAAKKLGVSLRSLYRKLEKLGIK